MNTWAEIKAAFDDIIRDPNDYIFTSAQKLRFVNRALREICERCKYVDEYEDIDTVSGTAEYSVTAEGYDIFRAEYDEQALMPITRSQLRADYEGYAGISGLPRFYYLSEIYSEQEALTLGLYEKPSTSVTDGLRIWYHAVPTTVTSATGEVEIPDWAAGTVLFYMLWIAYMAETNIQNEQTSALYYLMYEDMLERLIMRSNARQPKRWICGSPSKANVGYLSRLPDHIQAGPDAPADLGNGITRATSVTATAAEVAAGSAFSLFWDEVADANNYEVWRGTVSNNLNVFEVLVAGFDSEIDGWTDTTATTVGTYYYAVYGRDSNGYLGEQSRLFTLTVTA